MQGQDWWWRDTKSLCEPHPNRRRKKEPAVVRALVRRQALGRKGQLRWRHGLPAIPTRLRYFMSEAIPVGQRHQRVLLGFTADGEHVIVCHGPIVRPSRVEMRRVRLQHPALFHPEEANWALSLGPRDREEISPEHFFEEEMDDLDDESDSDEDRLSTIMPHQSASLMVTESADGYLVVVVVNPRSMTPLREGHDRKYHVFVAPGPSYINETGASPESPYVGSSFSYIVPYGGDGRLPSIAAHDIGAVGVGREGDRDRAGGRVYVIIINAVDTFYALEVTLHMEENDPPPDPLSQPRPPSAHVKFTMRPSPIKQFPPITGLAESLDGREPKGSLVSEKTSVVCVDAWTQTAAPNLDGVGVSDQTLMADLDNVAVCDQTPTADLNCVAASGQTQTTDFDGVAASAQTQRADLNDIHNLDQNSTEYFIVNDSTKTLIHNREVAAASPQTVTADPDGGDISDQISTENLYSFNASTQTSMGDLTQTPKEKHYAADVSTKGPRTNRDDIEDSSGSSGFDPSSSAEWWACGESLPMAELIKVRPQPCRGGSSVPIVGSTEASADAATSTVCSSASETCDAPGRRAPRRALASIYTSRQRVFDIEIFISKLLREPWALPGELTVAPRNHGVSTGKGVGERNAGSGGRSEEKGELVSDDCEGWVNFPVANDYHCITIGLQDGGRRALLSLVVNVGRRHGLRGNDQKRRHRVQEEQLMGYLLALDLRNGEVTVLGRVSSKENTPRKCSLMCEALVRSFRRRRDDPLDPPGHMVTNEPLLKGSPLMGLVNPVFPVAIVAGHT